MNVQKFACAFAAASITTTALVVTLAPAAFAKSPIEVIGKPLPEWTKEVSYTDLNLATDAGERTLRLRVGDAVRFVCKDAIPMGSSWLEYRSCRTFAWSGAGPQIERAVRRAHDFAANGKSDIPVVALAIVGPR